MEAGGGVEGGSVSSGLTPSRTDLPDKTRRNNTGCSLFSQGVAPSGIRGDSHLASISDLSCSGVLLEADVLFTGGRVSHFTHSCYSSPAL